MRIIRKRIRRIKRYLANNPIVKRILIGIGISALASMVLFFSLFLKQHQFEKSVQAAQQQATQQVQKQSKNHQLKGSKVNQASYSATDVNTLSPNDLKTVDPVKQVNEYGIGMLEIPAISMELPILEGVTQANLSVGASTAKEGQQLGKKNFVLLGHYMTNSGLLFGGLRNLQKGNDIHVTYQGKRITYEVQEIKVISNHEIEYMEDTKQDNGVLTLITCDSTKDQTPNRLIVRAQVKK